MYVNFDQLPDSARVWIFQSAQELTPEQENAVRGILQQFLTNWQAHGHDLIASFAIEHKRFLIITLDENSYQATGCSIDKLTHLILAIEKELSISLMDRMQISYVGDQGVVESLPMNRFKEELKNQLTADTLVFNNLIETKGQLKQEWQVPVKDSWHKRFLA
jgi:hypothetical protein